MAAEKKSASELRAPSVLAFERKIDPSDAVFESGSWETKDGEGRWKPVLVRQKSVRGTISNRLADNKDLKVESANPQTVDVATLGQEDDTLRVRFTLRVLGNVGQPQSCNDPAYAKALMDKIAEYKKNHQDEGGLHELARRYVYNLASGKFLWRNLVSCSQAEVKIKCIAEGPLKLSESHEENLLCVFDVAEFGNWRLFKEPDTDTYKDNLKKLENIFFKALSGEERSYALFEVIAHARMGAGQEVFPSQEMVLDKKKGESDKILYSINGTAGMHSQKIGNAIRTIDTWYPRPLECKNDDSLMPINIDPYGTVTQMGISYRNPKNPRADKEDGQIPLWPRKDFYTLLDTWMDVKNPAKCSPGTVVEKISEDDLLFIMAMLIRGGVFGGKSENGKNASGEQE